MPPRQRYFFTSPIHPEAEKNAHNEYHRLYRTGLDHEAIKEKMGPANYQLVLNYTNRNKFFARQRKMADEQAKATLPSGTAATQNEFNPDLELNYILDKALGANNSYSYSYILPRLPALAVPRGSCSSATPGNSTGQGRPPEAAIPLPLLSHLLDPGAISRAARRRRANRLREKKTNRGRGRGVAKRS